MPVLCDPVRWGWTKAKSTSDRRIWWRKEVGIPVGRGFVDFRNLSPSFRRLLSPEWKQGAPEDR